MYRSGIIQVHVTRNSIKVPILSSKTGVVIKTWRFTAQIAKKFWFYKDTTIGELMSGCFSLKNILIIILFALVSLLVICRHFNEL